MQNLHTKKLDSLKCSDCQDVFKNQSLLKAHTKTVDCPIRCPDCGETFDKKSMRTVHQDERHSGVERMSDFMQIDDAVWRKIKDNVKKFTASPKPGEPGHDPNSKIAKWIAKNTPRYMMGRTEDAKANFELGQWYTMFCTLSSPENIPEHPCK